MGHSKKGSEPGAPRQSKFSAAIVFGVSEAGGKRTKKGIGRTKVGSARGEKDGWLPPRKERTSKGQSKCHFSPWGKEESKETKRKGRKRGGVRNAKRKSVGKAAKPVGTKLL